MIDLRTGKEMTRREIVKGGLGLAAILAAGKAPAMLLGARGVAMGGAMHKPSSADYVQDGLIGMWLATENAGVGIHEERPASWYDLSGNGNHLTIKSASYFTDTEFIVPSNGTKNNSGAQGNGITIGNGYVCEIVAIRDSPNARFVFQNNGDSVCILNYRSSSWTRRVQWRGSGINLASVCDIENGIKIFAGVRYTASGVSAAFVDGERSEADYSNGWESQNYLSVGFSDANSQFGALRVMAIRFYSSLTDEQIKHNHDVDVSIFGE